MIQTITNLYPYPDQPTRGLFNLQLFRELEALTEVNNIVLVANTNPLRAPRVRRWSSPPNVPAVSYIPYQHLPRIGRSIAWRFIAHALRQSLSTSHVPQSTLHNPPATAHSPLPSSVLASWLYPDGTATAMAFKAIGVPVWTMILGTDRFHLDVASRRDSILQADQHTVGYICVSQNIAKDAEAKGLPGDKIHVVRNGVDRARFRRIPHDEAISRLPDPIPEASSSPPHTTDLRPLVLFIGNLIPIKAPDIALRAFSELLSRSSTSCPGSPASGPQLVFIGDGPMKSSLESMACELGIRDSVRFLGRRPHAEIPLWLNAADCLLLSSQSEGMPNAVTEALACGCAVVATDVGACREMLTSQPCCRVVPVNDPQVAGDALNSVLQEAAQTQERPTFTRTWADMAQDILALIKNSRAE